MKQFIGHLALVVKDYDEAIRFYTEKLGFILVEDTVLSETKRWVLVAPQGPGSALSYWRKQQNLNNFMPLAIKQADAFFYFFTPTILTGITGLCWKKEFISD